MLTLTEDESNVARCSAVEGLSLLAAAEPSLRDTAEDVIERYLQSGTLAMKSRARQAAAKLLK
jgi:hypothetical protein